MKGIVVGMGEALWDVLPEGKKLGGAPANFAYHVSQFGLDSCVVSAVGDDPLGHEIIENFTSKGLNQHTAATGTARAAKSQSPSLVLRREGAKKPFPRLTAAGTASRKS